MATPRLGTAWVVLLLLSGCPEDGGESGGSGTEGQSDRARDSEPGICAAHIAWVQRCEDEPDFSYTTEWGEVECPMVAWHYAERAYVDAVVECFETLPCASSDDRCVEQGLRALGIESASDLADDAQLQRCLDVADACVEVIDDVCLAFVVFTPAGRSAASKCLDLPCADVEACIQDPGRSR
jgi:hypothetical protein